MGTKRLVNGGYASTLTHMFLKLFVLLRVISIYPLSWDGDPGKQGGLPQPRASVIFSSRTINPCP